MPILTVNFEPGTTGEVLFISDVYRFDTQGNEVGAPFTATMVVNSTTETIELVSGVDPDVDPNPWSYTVKFRLNGQYEFLAYLTMPMTDTDLTDDILLPEPVTPEYFVLKSDFLDHLEAVGDPASVEDVTEAVAVETARAELAEGVLTTGLAAEITRATGAEGAIAADLAQEIIDRATDVDAEEAARIIDVDAEETRATLAEAGLDSRLDAEEALSVTFDSRLDAVEADDVVVDGRLDTIEAALPLKAPLASPTFTGDPKGPTAAPGDNDTSLATTAFVTVAVAAEATARNTAIGVETTNRIADVDAEESRALAAEALLAPLASPALTGNPTAPTQTAGNNTTRLATTAFVTTAVAAEATSRDTAIGVETSRATAAEALLAPKASPTFTGTVTVPTPTVGDNTTKAASTAFVTTAVANEATARIADVDAEETRALAAEALKANIASPTFTGDPKAPTPATTDNDTSIATTAWGQTNFALLVPKSLGTAKGDIAIWTASGTPVRHGVGADGTMMFADSTQTDGWNSRMMAFGDLPSLPKCTIADSAVSIASSATETAIGTTATESVDTDGFHSNVTNRGRITIPAGLGGSYLAMAKVSWPSNATGFRRVNVLVNGVTANTLYVIGAVSGSAMNFAFTLMLSGLVATDFLQVEVAQTSGGNLNATLSEFTVWRVGP